MKLSEFNFSELTEKNLLLGSFKTEKSLLAEAKERGFYNGNTKYNKLFSNLFYEDGKVVFKKGIDASFSASAWRYCRHFMGSWDPKHEDKEAICALIMSEILDA